MCLGLVDLLVVSEVFVACQSRRYWVFGFWVSGLEGGENRYFWVEMDL